MLKWFAKQLTEPTAWICTIIALMIIFGVAKGYILIFCVIGVLMDEEWMAAKCKAIAPGISAKIEKWYKEIFE